MAAEDYGDTYQDLMAGLKLLEPFLVLAKMTTEEEFEELYQQALAELMLDSFCGVGYMLTVWGKKPA